VYIVFLYMLQFQNKTQNIQKFKQDFVFRHRFLGVPPLLFTASPVHP